MEKDSKQKLIEIAMKIFAEHGYKSASTRMIAKEADINISAISYYFEGKEGLYKAVIEHVLDHVQLKMMPVAQEIFEELQKDKLSKKDIRELVKKIFSAFIAMLFDEKKSEEIRLIVIREQMQPGFGFEILYERMMKRFHLLLSTLVAKYFDANPDDLNVRIMVHTLIGQLLVFKFSREVLYRALETKKYKKEHIEVIRKTLFNNIDAIFKASKLSAETDLKELSH